MKINDLKINHCTVKRTLAAGLLGTVAIMSIPSFINLLKCGDFKPLLSKDDKVFQHKVVSYIYSKDSKKKTSEYLEDVKHSKLLVFNIEKGKNNIHFYSYDISSLDKAEIKYVISLVKHSKNNYKISHLENYILNCNDTVKIYDNNLKDKYFSSDEYGVKCIIQKENLNDSIEKPFIQNDGLYYTASSLLPFIGFGLGCTSLMLKDEIEKEKKEKVKKM